MSILSSTCLGGDNFKITIRLLIGQGFIQDVKMSDEHYQIWRKYNGRTATKVICSIDLHAKNPRYFVLPDIKVLDDEPKNTSVIEEEIPEYIDGKHAVEQYVIEVKNEVEFCKAIKKTEEILKVIPKSWLL